MFVNQHDGKQGRSSQQMSQGFQMEMAIDIKLRAAQGGRQVKLSPDVLGSAGKNRFALSSITADFSGEPHQAFNIFTGAVALPLIL